MKPFLILICILTFHLNAQTTKTIKPKPIKAIVYLSGAEIGYLETLSLGAGTTELIVEGISPSIDENSISAYFKGGMVIDTKKNIWYPEPPKLMDIENKYQFIINRINDSIEELGFLLKDCSNKTLALQKEKNLLLDNRLMKGEFVKDSIALLKAALDLLKSRLNRIDESELVIERKIARLNKLETRLNERLEYYNLLQSSSGTMINTDQYKGVTQLIVTIETEVAITGNLSLKYYVPYAGWVPRYDIQAASGKEKIQLVYRAQVYQNSGLDWKDVSLTLSTSNPSIGNTKPTLSTWNLYFGYPGSYPELVNKKSKIFTPQLNTYNNNITNDSKVKTTDDESNAGAGPVIEEPVFTVGDNFMSTEYEIKTKYSIVSDNKAHNVIVNSIEIPVTLAYMAVPKMDKDAFLMGKLANWEDLNLIPASARIYFDESYIGSTVIDPATTRDTLYVNLGRDRSIIMKRMAVKEKCKETVLGEFKVVSKTIEISVRNTKSINLQFEIEDQVPLSSDNNIKITVLEQDGAVYLEETGRLTWKMNIKPKDTKKVKFSYEIRYPKDKFLMGL